MTAFRTGYKAFIDPEAMAAATTVEERSSTFAVYWAYYAGSIYSRRGGDNWRSHLYDREMYKHTRLIYNPVPQIVDFYADNIWKRHERDEEFPSLVTPLAEDTRPDIKDAVSQIDQWTNFASEAHRIKRYAAAVGGVLVEGVDDLERRKVLHKVTWAGHLLDFQLNNTGDLIAYTVEYPVYDPDKKQTYRYRKVVTRESYSYYRDDRPFIPEGKTAEVEPNDYGFCFAVILRHRENGPGFGVPACKDFDKVDELNMLASHLHDNIHKEIESPKIIATDGKIKSITGASDRGEDTIDFQDPRLHWAVLKAPAGSSVLDLSSMLKLAEADPYLDRLIKSFANDYPELQAAEIIQNNAEMSGAALERLLGPAQNRLDGVQPNYNNPLVKLRQMQMAVGGMRANAGDWGSPGELSNQQKKFLPYSMNSYERGDIDFHLDPAVLVHQTEMERTELKLKKAEVAEKLKALTDREYALGEAGLTEDEIKEILARSPEPEPQPNVTPVGVPENRQLTEAVN